MAMQLHAPNPASSVIADLRAKMGGPAGQQRQAPQPQNIPGYASGTAQVAPQPGWFQTITNENPPFSTPMPTSMQIGPQGVISVPGSAANTLVGGRGSTPAWAPGHAPSPVYVPPVIHNRAGGQIGGGPVAPRGQQVPAIPAAAPTGPAGPAITNAGFLASLFGRQHAPQAAPEPKQDQQDTPKPAAPAPVSPLEQLYQQFGAMDNAQFQDAMRLVSMRPNSAEQAGQMAVANTPRVVGQYPAAQQPTAFQNMMLAIHNNNPMGLSQANAMAGGMQQR